MPGGGPLAGRAMLVTGATRGIGNAVARALADAGAVVGIVARRAELLSELAAELDAVPLPANIASPEDVEELARRWRANFAGPPDAIVNCAGAFSLAPFDETSPADFEAQIAVNLTGPFLVIRAFLPEMRQRRSGHIVNVGSIAGRVPLAGNAAYGASKFGMHGLHEILALELAGSGVRTTLIEPAATDTPLWDALDPDSRDDLPARGQMLRADDVARAIRFVLEQPPGVEISRLAIRQAT